jgi:hypothetical protein
MSEFAVRTAPGSTQRTGLPGWKPYVYGATRGTPSRGRPGLVLAAGLAPETAARRFERELGEGITAPDVHGRRQVQPCGTTAAYQRHMRRNEDACESCLAAVRAAYHARRGYPPRRKLASLGRAEAENYRRRAS